MAADPSAPISVAHVGPVTPGGMSAVLQGLLSSALAERYRMTLIATYRTAEPRGRLTSFLRGLGGLAVWCLRPGPRVVHVHTAVRGSLYRKSLCVLVARALRRPVVLHVHAGVGDIRDFAARLGPYRRAAFRRALLSADRVLSVSAAGALELERRFGLLGVTVVPNAAPQVDEAVIAARRPPAPGAPVRVLYLGGFEDPAKGGTTMAAAAEMLVADASPVVLVLAGPGEPPATLARLPAERVRWAGWLDAHAKAAEIAACDVFVLPSISEGLPMALLEAMANGLPIVASRMGGVPEVVSDGVQARLVEPGDAAGLRTAIAALAADADLRARLGTAARERARRLNDDEVSGRLDSIYRELAGVA